MKTFNLILLFCVILIINCHYIQSADYRSFAINSLNKSGQDEGSDSLMKRKQSKNEDLAEKIKNYEINKNKRLDALKARKIHILHNSSEIDNGEYDTKKKPAYEKENNVSFETERNMNNVPVKQIIEKETKKEEIPSRVQKVKALPPTTKCFTYEYEEYRVILDKSFTVLKNQCGTIIGITLITTYLELIQKLAKFEVYLEKSADKIDEAFLNSFDNAAYSSQLTEQINYIKTQWSNGNKDINLDRTYGYIKTDTNVEIKDKGFSDENSKRSVDLYLSTSYYLTMITEYIAIDVAVKTTCLPSNWKIIITFVDDADFTGFKYYEIRIIEKADFIDITPTDTEGNITITFWSEENSEKLVKKANQELGTASEFNADYIKAAQRQLAKIFLPNNDISYNISQDLNVDLKTTTTYDFGGKAYDINKDSKDAGVKKDITGLSYKSDSACSGWVFHYIQFRRECDHYEVTILQENMIGSQKFGAEFKIKIEDFDKARIKVLSYNNFVKNVHEFVGIKQDAKLMNYLKYYETKNDRYRSVCPPIDKCKYFSDDECDICDDGFFYNKLTKKCEAECPDGYYKYYYVYITNKIVQTICAKCDFNCAKCTADQCTECIAPYKLNDKTCELKCKEDTMKIEIDGKQICRKCNSYSRCKVCASAIECKVCYPPYFLKEGECVTNCEIGFYEKEGVCHKCCPCCQDCDKDRCKTCKDHYYLKDDKYCEPFCGNGYFRDASKKICWKCPGECNNCRLPSGINILSVINVLDSLVCTECVGDTILTTDGRCTTICKIGYSPFDGTCQYCTKPYCNSCLTNVDRCSKCNNDYYLNTYDWSCVKKCPDRTYLKDGRCYTCKVECATCNALNECITCEYPKVLNGRDCVFECPDNYVEENGICTRCTNTLCKSCLKNDKSKCGSCLNDALYIVDGNCVMCPSEGYYEYAPLKECRKCPDDCTSCDISGCKKCASGKYLWKGICREACPLGTRKFNGICQECTDHKCYKCDSDPDKCTECPANLFYIPYKCVDSCYKHNMYPKSDNKCESCLNNCAYCNSSQICLKCKPGFSLCNNNTMCCAKCPKGFYEYTSLTENAICKKCTDRLSYCTECSSENKCQLCDSGWKLIEDKWYCARECPDGYFQTANGLRCSACSVNCKTCETSKDKCKECLYHYALDTATNKCVAKCPDGQVKNDAGVCIACLGVDCKTCVSATIKQCLECKDPKFLQVGECKTKCDDGYYLLNKICYKCNSLCGNCFGSSDSDCIDCPSEYPYLFNNKCYKKCFTGYVPIYYTPKQGYYVEKYICEKCPEKCKVCNDEKKCTECEDDKVLQNGECVTDCDSGLVLVGNICKKCDVKDCNECSDGVDTCTKCNTGQLLSVDKRFCWEFCEWRSRPVLPERTCIPCDVPYCINCDLDAYNCQQCENGYFLYMGVCRKECPQSTYGMLSSDGKNAVTRNISNYWYYIYYYKKNAPPKYQKCLPCGDSCLYCEVNGETEAEYNCKKCDTHTILMDGVCVSTCPAHWVKVRLIDYYECRKCNDFVNCITCNPTDRGSCIKCKPGQFLKDGVCQTYCDEDEYKNELLGECIKCSDYCQECKNDNECKRCGPGKELLSNGKCDDKCQSGYIRDTMDRCIRCEDPWNCHKCDKNDIKKCITCGEGLTLYNYRCWDVCPIRTYVVKNAGGFLSCESCGTNCKRCRNAVDCKECVDPNRFKLQPDESGTNYKCYEKCDEGWYNESDSNICRRCFDSRCRRCTNHDNCQECIDGFRLYDNHCVKICPHDTLYVDGKCRACPSGCYKCNIKDECVECDKNNYLRYLYNNKCYDKCPEKSVESGLVPYHCSTCGEYCLTCTDYSSCLKCDAGYYLQVIWSGIACVRKCNFGYSHDPDSGRCVKCENNCSRCSKETYFRSCIECPYGFYKYLNTDIIPNLVQCVKQCEPGSGLINNECFKCENCLTCRIAKDRCYSCPLNKVLQGYQCKDECDAGFYSVFDYNYKAWVCYRCHPKCQTCSDKYDNCTLCANYTHKLIDGKCDDKCPQFQVDINTVCKDCTDKTSCIHCRATNRDFCLECKAPKALTHLYKCEYNCPSGYYKRMDYFGYFICTRCLDDYCEKCDGSGNCEVCISPKVLTHDHGCEDECPYGQVTLNNKDCTICQTGLSCAKCDRTRLDTCVGCVFPYRLNSRNNTCVLICDPNQFEKIVLHENGWVTCSSCARNCRKCDNEIRCLVCENGFYLSNGICVNECEDGYVLQRIPYMPLRCTRCPDKCKICDPMHLSCIVCDNGLLLINGKCKELCDEGYYEFNGECIICSVFGCNACGADGNCLPNLCRHLYYFFDGKCYLYCPIGTRPMGNTCVKCSISNCINCDSGSNRCIQCKDNMIVRIKLDGSYECINPFECRDYYYIEGNICRKCTTPCLTCTSATSCITCIAPYKYYKGSCIISPQPPGPIDPCKEGQYPFIDLNGRMTCVDCNNKEKCKYCNPLTKKCEKCLAGYLFYNDDCWRQCPDGTYRSDDNWETEGKCLECDSDCELCTGPSTCTRCLNGFYLKIVGNQKFCGPICGDGYTTNVINRTCDRCDTQDMCCTCDNIALTGLGSQNTGASTRGDLKKRTGEAEGIENLKSFLLKHTDNANLNKTVKENNRMSFKEIESLLVTPTESSRNEITILTHIIDTKFRANAYFYKAALENKSDLACKRCCKGYLLENSICVRYCSVGYYEDGPNCRPCGVSNCVKCYLGIVQGTYIPKPICIECMEGLYKQNGFCVKEEDCYAPYSLINGFCTTCHINNCQKCNNLGTMCLICKDNQYLSNGICVNKCPKGYTGYYHNNHLMCVHCLHSCIECLVAFNGNSLMFTYDDSKCKCDEGKILKNGRCIDPSCEIGYVEINGECRKCSGVCTKCHKTDIISCTECPDVGPMYLFKGYCLYECPNGYYNDGIHCIKCNHENCEMCNPWQFGCARCYPGFFLNNDGECVLCNKPNETFDGRRCTKCSEKCKNCEITDNKEICIVCEKNHILINNKCILKCLAGYYEDNGKCIHCGKDCDKCTDSKNCIDCTNIPGKVNFLFNGECKSVCPDGSYWDIDYKTCRLCPPKCVECDANICYKCPPGMMLSEDKKSCLSGICTVGFYKKLVGLNQYVCAPCGDIYGSDCSRCNEYTCEACIPPKLLSSDKKTCVSSCPLGTTPNSNGVCNSCPEYCQKCSNTLFCDVCFNPYVLKNGYCENECGDKHILVNGKCIKCPTYCQQCSSLTHCNICIDKFFIDANFQCVPDCPQGYIRQGNVCKICRIANCKTCKDNDQSSCGNCNYGFYLLNGKCVNDCPIGFFKDQTLQKCEKCHHTCKSCNDYYNCTECIIGFKKNTNDICEPLCKTGEKYINGKCECCKNKRCGICSDSESCISCKSDKILINGKCVPECPIGYYKFNYLQSGNSSRLLPIPIYRNRMSYRTLMAKRTERENLLEKLKSFDSNKNSLINMYICRKCMSNCVNCSNNQTCDKCLSGYYRDSEGKCVQKCMAGYWENCENNTCDRCIDGCALCNSKGQCEVCYDGLIMKLEFQDEEDGKTIGTCHSRSTVTLGFFLNGDKDCFEECSVAHCEKCIDSSNRCQTCASPYNLYNMGTNDVCNTEKNSIKFFSDSKIFDENITVPFSPLERLEGFEDLVTSCSNFKELGFVFHFRLITDPMMSPQKRHQIFQFKDTVNFSLSLNYDSNLVLEVQSPSKNYENITTNFNFKMLGEWNIMTAVIYAETDKIIADLKVFNLNFKEFIDTKRITIPLSEYSFPTNEVNMLTKNAQFGINNTPSKSAIFEMANFNIIEYNPELNDFKNTFATQSIMCEDINCQSCSPQNPFECKSCKVDRIKKTADEFSNIVSNIQKNMSNMNKSNDSKDTSSKKSLPSPNRKNKEFESKENKDGIIFGGVSCNPTYIPIREENGFNQLDRINNGGFTKRLSSGLYTFTGYIFTKTISYIQEEIKLIELRYDDTANLALQVYIENSVVGLRSFRNAKKFDKLKLNDNTWYSITVSVDAKNNDISVRVFEINGSTLRNNFASGVMQEQVTLTRGALRITEKVSINRIASSVCSTSDFRLYINSKQDYDDIKTLIEKNFAFPKNCDKANANLRCQECLDSYTLRDGNCIRISNRKLEKFK